MFWDDLETDVQDLIEAKKSGKHLCLSGRYVNCYSETCKNDLQRRIKDAIHFRDHADCRTDARTYYNGLLRVLRRKFREVERELNKRQLAEDSRRLPEKRRERRKVTIDQRILKLSGLL